jgi:hypothetical protein
MSEIITRIIVNPTSFEGKDGKTVKGAKLTLYREEGTTIRDLFVPNFGKAEAQAIGAAKKDGLKVQANLLWRKGKRPLLRGFDTQCGKTLWERFDSDDQIVIDL